MTYEGLMSAKTKEVITLSAQIEVEIKRVGELGVEITEAADDVEDTKAALAENGRRSRLPEQRSW